VFTAQYELISYVKQIIFRFYKVNNKHESLCTCNVEASSCIHCCRGKAIIFIYSKHVSVALVNQHAMRTRHIAICDLSGSTTFFHIISLTEQLSEKTVTQPRWCVLIFSTKFVWNIFHYRENWARYNQKFILFFTYSTLYSYYALIILEFSRHICER
jgi:hypothetical protein